MKKLNILFVGMILLSILSTGFVNAANEGTTDYKTMDVKLISHNTVYEDSVLRLKVKVRDKDTKTNIEGATVNIVTPAMPEEDPIRTDRKGRAIFDIQLPKVTQKQKLTIYATISAPGYYPVIRATKTITIKPALRLQLSIPKAVKEGQGFIARAVVTDKRTGSRVSGATVEFSDPWIGNTRQVTTNDNGAATIVMWTQHVTENTKKIVTAKVNYNGFTATNTKSILVKATHTKQLKILTGWRDEPETHTRLYMFRVTADGEPVEGVRLVITSAERDVFVSSEDQNKVIGTTDSNGDFNVRLQTFTEKGYQITTVATKDGYKKKTKTETVDAW